MPLYNSFEVFVPAKQYGNTIHSGSLDIKKIKLVTSLIVPRVKFEPESSSSHESSSSQVKFSFFFLVVLFLIAV